MTFIYSQSFIHHFTGLFGTNLSLLAQLVKRCTGIAEVMGSNPVQAWTFFRPYFHYCLSSVHCCEDCFHIQYILCQKNLTDFFHVGKWPWSCKIKWKQLHHIPEQFPGAETYQLNKSKLRRINGWLRTDMGRWIPPKEISRLIFSRSCNRSHKSWCPAWFAAQAIHGKHSVIGFSRGSPSSKFNDFAWTRLEWLAPVMQ